jgi:hypothetical protein
MLLQCPHIDIYEFGNSSGKTSQPENASRVYGGVLEATSSRSHSFSLIIKF